MVKDFLAGLHKTGALYRSAPFWAWNGTLEESELLRQIHEFHAMGMGGFFIHARVGLAVPYLGAEWFRLVRRCVEEAKSLGMAVWLYDEDRWPSGTAGGKVTADRRFRGRTLVMSRRPLAEDADTHRIAAFRLTGDPESPDAWERIAGDAVQEDHALYFYARLSETESWYNGASYVDTLNPEAVARFIELTHEAYRREIGNEFGRTVQGIFTDEPNYRTALFSENAGRSGGSGAVKLLPWTDRLPERFREKFHYDLLDCLPELFFERGGAPFSQVRHDFFEVVTGMFVDAYAKQIGSWCEANRLPLAGHVHWEDSLLLQRHQVGAAMRFYPHMQIPGVDLLTDHWAIYDTVKQCTSAAAQSGRVRRISEHCGCTGWDFPLFGHKALGEWQYALGINFRCQHLAWYTMAGEAKRDYPASISFQSPWKECYPVVEEHFARLSFALSSGRERREILVLHPIESVWGYKHDDHITTAEQDREDRTIIDVRNALLAANRDFDYGDEEFLAGHGAVLHGRLVVGEMDYGAVVIPVLRTIRSSTLKLVEAFHRAGGVVVTLGGAPEYVDALPSPEAGKIFSHFRTASPETLDEALGSSTRLVSVQNGGVEADPVLTQIRQGEDFQLLYLCNVGHALAVSSLGGARKGTPGIEGDQKAEPGVWERRDEFPRLDAAWRSIGAECSLYEIDPGSGKVYRVPSAARGDVRKFETSLPQLGSRLFLETAQPVEFSPRPVEPRGEVVLELPASGWEYSCDEPNVLVLDHAVCNGDPCDYILNIDARLRDALGVPRRGGAMMQPYVTADRTPRKHLAVTLEYTFGIAEPAGAVDLVLEHPELYALELNGVRIAPEPRSWWIDPALRRIPLDAGLLKTGRNTLVLKTDFHEYHPGFEAVYLLGGFAVRHDTLCRAPERINIGDWCPQGFPYYAGNLVYRHAVPCPSGAGALWLEFGQWRGCALGVSVNGSPRRSVLWAPFRIGIGDLLHEGSNTLEIVVYGHRRNACGPFYLNDPAPAWVGPAQFKTVERNDKSLVPCGLLTPPRIVR